MNSSLRISPGCTGFSFLAIILLLVIIHDLDFVGVTFAPLKANAPLVVDTNAVLTLPVSLSIVLADSLAGSKASGYLGRVEQV